MPRVGSGDFLDMGTWADEEDPGAGPQTFDAAGEAGQGLNGNMIRPWKAIVSILSNFGLFKNDIIDGNALKSTVVDGSTLEPSASTGAKAFRIKDAGVTAPKLATDAVETAKIKDANVTAPKLATDAVETAKIKDLNVTTPKLADRAVTPVKMSHDSSARKAYIPFSITSGSVSNEYRMPRAGAITGWSLWSSNASGQATQTYATAVSAGTGKFGTGDRLQVTRHTSTGVSYPRVNNTNVVALILSDSNWAIDNIYCLIEVELDD